jgi:hypothetical protein
VKYLRGGEANLCCSVLTFPVEEAAPSEIAAEVFGGDAVRARHPAHQKACFRPLGLGLL